MPETVSETDKLIAELRLENTKLRGIIARSGLPCLYCGEKEMAKCPSGFPGCGKMDDLMAMNEIEGVAYEEKPPPCARCREPSARFEIDEDYVAVCSKYPKCKEANP